MKRIILTAGVSVLFALASLSSAQDESLSEVKISATVRTYVLRAPRPNAELVATFDAGAESNAYGRDQDGRWLRILIGWVLAEVFNTEGEIGALPDTTHSFVSTTIENARLFDGPSARWFDELGALDKGAHALVIGRNEDSTWLRSPGGWMDAATLTNVGDVSLLPVTPSGVIITAKTRTFILKEPDLSAEFVDVFEAGEEALAIGQAGEWVQIAQGWVSAEAVQVAGDLLRLPFLSQGLKGRIVGIDILSVRSKPSYTAAKTSGRLRRGEEVLVIGRNKSGFWLHISEGWINDRYIKLDGDAMSLPVTDGNSATVSSSASTRRATPTPTPGLNPRTIRSLISRHTDDIRILDIETASNSTTIEYDLKPWPFVPNESIANEVAFKIICAIRVGQQVPNTLKFIGHTHFKSEVGRKFTGPSVEMHISARNANRIVCQGNDPSDINWRSLSSRYKSYPIPRGASINYD